ncbi:hypothetical protein HETIRDRAFT_332267 [Heterobasidion irregulare TC 32-1]|uniref:Uncharacterized protein n=1 Tax=Heterobasidion irregulare (strain TC 32-1) TaxID=747525 RepID=W4JMZ8_HETIT|nr:uncharacterized protein HETIRDRAFT_332267 [Heterobasidion irregulare TC 32-1]ETW74908.1 hypothetical protein HETIRDRAFT_332267 [Heterobasidion irregulare TC 32-1]
MSENKQSEDVVPQLELYSYAWSPSCAADVPLDTFLSKYKPSLVQDDGTKPWIWVQGSQAPPKDSGEESAIQEAINLLKEVTEKVEKIKNDSTIPTRSNKKTGAKSKKELREAEQAKATERLTEISTQKGYVSGKWLIFAPPEKVDTIWSAIATSLVSGPLSSTSASLAKVATCPISETPNYQHLLCIYLPNVYDKAAVTEVRASLGLVNFGLSDTYVMRVLLRNHGMNVLGVKANLYTAIVGLDSKHPSGIQSTVWKPNALIEASEAKALKDAYFVELETNKAVDKIGDEEREGNVRTKAKPKPRLKLRKQANNNPFASDDDENDGGAKVQKPARRTKATKKRTTSASEDEDGENDESDTGRKTKRVRSK